jgi:hypothetical protein
MAYITRTRFGYYVNRNFILPTSTANFILQAAAQDAAHKGCACHGKCGHCGGKKYRRMGLRGLGDDSGDLIDTSGDFTDISSYSVPDQTAAQFYGIDTTSGGIFGPQPTDQTLALNAAQGLAPGTSGQVPSWAQAGAGLIASIFNRPSSSSRVPVTAPGQQSALTMPVAGLGVSPLVIGGIVLGGVVLISVMKSGRRR